MKKTLLSAAIAAVALASFSQGAFALLPATSTPDIEVFMAGASAQDKAIRALFVNLCGKPGGVNPAGGSQSTDLDIFTFSGHEAYFCTLKAYDAATNPNGVKNLTVGGAAVAQAKVLFHKRNAGGSAQGVNPLIANAAIAYMPVTVANCPGAAVLDLATGQTTTACTAATPTIPSDAGISDVEPAQFTGGNVPLGSTAVTPAGLAALTVQPAAALVFGVPVTTPLYVALQKAQGLLAGTTPACTPGQYTEACMPSLTKAQVATLTAGKLNSWEEFKLADGTNLVAAAGNSALGPNTFVELDGGAAKNIVPTLTNSDLVTHPFHYCKRINGSGTNAVHNIVFLNNPCLGSIASPAVEQDWLSTFDGRQVHEVSSADGAVSDMEKCLSDFSNGTNIGKQQNSPTSTLFTAAVNPGLGTAWAIGQQSLEKNAGAIPANHYRFIKIDGVAPTLENAFKGKYIDWSEPTYQWRTSINVDKLAIVKKVADDAASPAVIASDLNPSYIHAFGQSGYLANGNNFAFGSTLNISSPVMPYSHASDGPLNNCKSPTVPTATTTNPSKPFGM